MNETLVEVVTENLKDNPHCFHGPTLLFKRLQGKVKEYYACSACRSNKDCNFFVPATDLLKPSTAKLSNDWKNKRKLAITEIRNQNLHKKYLNLLNKIDSISSLPNNKQIKSEHDDDKNKPKNILNNTGYCYTCSCLFIEYEHHLQCRVLTNPSYHQLKHPTEILVPKTDAKTHAQYFFSQSTINIVVNLITKLKACKILCIGAPKIHECLLNNYKHRFKSILLDIDKNYYNFYSENEFIWYNMFNNHIFDEEQTHTLYEFLSSGKIVILLDPPFGGRVEPLAYTLKELTKIYLESINSEKDRDAEKAVIDTMWFFPYFMEKHIQGSLPEFRVFDYKVNYENHSSFTDTGNRRRKFGSPVRIFTNIQLSLLSLEGVPGYRFCEFCNHWVAEENKHCKKCRACTSKDGRTYTHCVKCSKCVKPTYKHCETCKRCCLPSHVCGEFKPDTTCYRCRQPGHKKNDCPNEIKGAENKKGKKRKKIN